MTISSTVMDRFRARVAQSPDATALVAEGRRLSYAELDASSTRVAHFLRRHGAGVETVAALHVAHGLTAFVALLGIVKSGAAFVGLAPTDPPARTREILADSGAALLLTDRRDLDLRGYSGSTIRLPDDLATVQREPAAPLDSPAEAHHLFQIVYTSGSTGRPKGVLVPMRAILNRLDAMAAAYPFRADDVALLHRPLSIIGASWDCFGPLLGGVPTVIVKDFDPAVAAIWRQMIDLKVSHIAGAPSMWELMLDRAERLPGEWRTLRLAIIGGEPLAPALVRRWAAAFPAATLLNVYGASECVYATAWEADSRIEGNPDAPANTVPAGRPFPNSDARVLDDRLDPVPAGTIGEICIGGACLARGYINDRALTAERFVPHPYADEPGRILFRTGDLGVHGSDGLLYVTGRRDRQVKVHGFRVDPGELESALTRCAGIDEAAVIAVPDARGGHQLAAYVVTSDGLPLSVRDVRDRLAPIVPRHLMPAAVTTVPRMPRTPGGKIDRQQLQQSRAPERLATEIAGASTSAGGSEIAVWLAGVWRDALGAASVGAHDNFFDLGGDSLSAMRIAARIRDAHGVELDVTGILDAGTVERLAESIATLRGDGFAVAAAIPQGER